MQDEGAQTTEEVTKPQTQSTVTNGCDRIHVGANTREHKFPLQKVRTPNYNAPSLAKDHLLPTYAAA